jgi:hypothetical protein
MFRCLFRGKLHNQHQFKLSEHQPPQFQSTHQHPLCILEVVCSKLLLGVVITEGTAEGTAEGDLEWELG